MTGLTRRRFLKVASAGAAVAAGGGIPLLLSCGERVAGPAGGDGTRTTLPQPGSIAAASAVLVAAPGAARIAAGESAPAWLINDSMPAPTLRARRGTDAGISLVNHLAEPTILHWHGLVVPELADGHPRYAIPPGATLDYRFPVVQRAGTYWYHPHAHRLTAGQVYRGMAGFFIISDDEEDALRLPRDTREILLVLQDRHGPASVALDYQLEGNDSHTGILRDIPFGNGVRQPTLDVAGGRYRFRVLNGSQARVFRLALSSGAPLTVIGNDGGLLPAPAEVDSAYLAVAERLDFLVDFSDVPVGTRLMLQSIAFDVPAVAQTSPPQGTEMDLLELVRTGATDPAADPIPATLSAVTPIPGSVAAERLFVLRSDASGDMHRINGLSFDMSRVDERIALGRTERWVFQNDSALPHPVHLHGTQFQVESRTGGRGTVYPYERGWKDTVLLMPLESVAVIVCFDRYRGIYPMHCHNLQHEDMGMMLNVEVT